jgi:hypothetical protein
MVYEEAKAFDGEWEQAGPEYEDRSQDEPPPEPREEPKEHPQSGMLKGLKSVRKFILKDRPAKEKRPLPIPAPPESDLDFSPSEGEGDMGPHAAEAPMTPDSDNRSNDTDPEEFWKGVQEEEDDYIQNDPYGRNPEDHLGQVRRGIRTKLTDAEAQAEAVSDVPASIKRALEEPTANEAEQEAKRVKETLLAGVMAAALETGSHANAWMNKDELQQLWRSSRNPRHHLCTNSQDATQETGETAN